MENIKRRIKTFTRLRSNTATAGSAELSKNALAFRLESFTGIEVRDEPVILQKYSQDASLFEVRPALVVFPKNSRAIQKLVKFINRRNTAFSQSNLEKLSLTARAAGTDMTGGPLNDSIILDTTKYLNRLKKITGNSAVAEPGMFYRDFEKATLKHGLIMPAYPGSKEICALGGMVANNAGGEKTLAYGKTANYILELKVILSDGKEYLIKPLTKKELEKKLSRSDFESQLYRRLYQLITSNKKLVEAAKPAVSKNSTGYALWDVWDGQIFDLTKLFSGSQGTLGIITQIKFKLIKPKKYSRLLVIFLNNTKPLAKVINQVLKHRPESFESFDDNTLRLALKHLFWQFSWQFLPEIMLTIKNNFRFPKLVLLAEFTADSEREASQKTLAAKSDLEKFHLPARITANKKDTQKYWTARRESFNLLRSKIKGKRTAPFIDDVIVRPELLPEFFPALEKILSRYPIQYTIAGHAGDGNFHIIPLIKHSDQKLRQIIPQLAGEVYDLVLKFNGSISAEHNDGLIRTPYLEKMYGRKVYQLFKEVKNIFDADNIFNPGKKVGANLAYSLNRLKIY